MGKRARLARREAQRSAVTAPAPASAVRPAISRSNPAPAAPFDAIVLGVKPLPRPLSNGLDELDRLRELRDKLEVRQAAAVARARASGATWADIGARLGVSAQAVHRRFRSLDS